MISYGGNCPVDRMRKERGDRRAVAVGGPWGVPQGVALEENTPGTRVRGIINGDVVVEGVQWHGSNALTVTYKDDTGRTDQRLLYRELEPSLSLVQVSRAYAFDGDRHAVPPGGRGAADPDGGPVRPDARGASSPTLSRCRTRSRPSTASCCRGPRCGSCSPTTPAPGKTIMAGLYIKELMLRGDLRPLPDRRAGQPGRAVAGRAARQVRAPSSSSSPGS